MAAVLACAAGGVLCSGAARSGWDDPGATMPILDFWGAALSHRAAASHWGLLSEADRTRDLSLRALGYDVMRFADSQIEAEPEQIAAVLGPRLASFPSNEPESRQAAP